MNNCRNTELWREQVSDAEELTHVAKQYDFHCHEIQSPVYKKKEDVILKYRICSSKKKFFSENNWFSWWIINYWLPRPILHNRPMTIQKASVGEYGAVGSILFLQLEIVSLLQESCAHTSSRTLKNFIDNSKRIQNKIFMITIDTLKNFTWKTRKI